MLTYYQVLQFAVDGHRSEDIKKAWACTTTSMASGSIIHAPVLQRKAEARTTLINQAYQTLNDPTSRQRYDATTSSTLVCRDTTASPHSSAAPDNIRTPPTGAAQIAERTTWDRISHHAVSKESAGAGEDSGAGDSHSRRQPRTHAHIFSGLTRIAGTTRQTLQAGDYAIAEAPDIFRVERKRAEELNTIFSNPSENRQRFMRELEPLLKIPHRFLVIEGALFQRLASGRLGQYHKNGLQDFLDALTARYGLQIIYTENRDEAEERVANLATLHYAYHYAEQEGLGRYLAENDV